MNWYIKVINHDAISEDVETDYEFYSFSSHCFLDLGKGKVKHPASSFLLLVSHCNAFPSDPVPETQQEVRKMVFTKLYT